MSWRCFLPPVLLVSGGRLRRRLIGHGFNRRGEVAKAPLAAGRHVRDVVGLVSQEGVAVGV